MEHKGIRGTRETVEVSSDFLRSSKSISLARTGRVFLVFLVFLISSQLPVTQFVGSLRASQGVECTVHAIALR